MVAALAPVTDLAHWIITQRTIHVVLQNIRKVIRHEKPFLTIVKTVGDLFMLPFAMLVSVCQLKSKIQQVNN